MNNKNKPEIKFDHGYAFHTTAEAVDLIIEKIAKHFDDWAEFDKNEYWPPSQVAKEIRKFKEWTPNEKEEL